MRSVLFQLVLALWAGGPALAGVFEDANRFYEQGKYSEAIPLYHHLVQSGHNSPGVLFNLGNAYFKSGELGRAIFFYRRAEQIAPRDPDVQANLRFARERVSGTASVQPSAVDQMLGYFKLDELTVASMLVLWVWIGLLCLARARPAATGVRPALRPYMVVCALLFVMINAALIAAYRNYNQQCAIVSERQATVRLGPLAESQPSFTAPDGTELRVLAHREDWLQVADRGNRTGWIDRRAVNLFP
jgi:tetratricopeptide (TPR) repeat protein